MRRRYQKNISKNLAALIVMFLIGAAVVNGVSRNAEGVNDTVKGVLFFAMAAVIILVGVFTIIWIYRYFSRQQRAQNFAALRAHEVDKMSGKEFEIFLKHLLTARGYTVKNMWHGNDGGVDLVAKLGEKTYSIQAKRYNNRHKVDRRAITDAVAGIKFRNCTHAMAITNSYFTKAAKEYAQKTNCELVNRDALARWIFELQEN